MTEGATQVQDSVVVEKPKASEISVLDLIKNKGLIKVPTEVVEIYTDAEAALEVAKLRVEQEQHGPTTKREVATLGEPMKETKVYPPEYQMIEDKIDELFAQMEYSKMIFKLKGIAPRERASIIDAAEVATSKHFDGKATPSDREKDQYQNIWFSVELLRRQLVAIEIPSVDGVQTDISHDELEELSRSLYAGDNERLQQASYRLLESSAINDAHDDAGFRSRKLNSTTE